MDVMNQQRPTEYGMVQAWRKQASREVRLDQTTLLTSLGPLVPGDDSLHYGWCPGLRDLTSMLDLDTEEAPPSPGASKTAGREPGNGTRSHPATGRAT